MSGEEWGPFITFFQGPRPVPQGTIVLCEMGYTGSGDFVGPLLAEDFDWDYPGDPIVRYKIKKPKGLTMLQELLQNLPTPVKEKETV